MKASKSTIILGIDPGFAITGWAILQKDNRNIKAVDYGVITTSADIEFAQRLKIIDEKINDLIKKFQPKIIAIEKIYFAKNTKTATAVGHARGIILLAAAKNNLKIKEFTPLQIKQSTTAYGRAEKFQMQKMIQAILKLPEIPQPDDAADALACAWLCAQTI